MGLRGLELRLLKHIREAIVVDAVRDYLEHSRAAGRLLNPAVELKKPILEKGFSPPGLQDAMAMIARLSPRTKPHVRYEPGSGIRVERVPDRRTSSQPLQFPDEDELIECILTPPRTRHSRKEARLHRLFNKHQG
jgi:hypothetical protein